MLHAKIPIQAEIEPRRREPRESVSAPVPLRQLGQHMVEGRLRNISSHGFMVETEARIEPGSRIWLTLPGAGRVNGLVIWSRNGQIGGELAEQIDPLSIMQAIGKAGL